MKKLFCLSLVVLICSLLIVSCGGTEMVVTINNSYNFRCEASLDSTPYTIYENTAKELYNYCAQAKSDTADKAGEGKSITLSFVGDKRKNPKKDSDSVVICSYVIYENDVLDFHKTGLTSINSYYSEGFYNVIYTLIMIYA